MSNAQPPNDCLLVNGQTSSQIYDEISLKCLYNTVQKSLTRRAVTLYAHGWFCTSFLGFMVMSSVPRVFTIVDYLITFVLYINSIDTKVNKSMTFDSTLGLISHDLKTYSFRLSLGDLMMLNLAKTIIYFHYFSYKKLKEKSRRNLTAPLCVALFYTLFVTLKYKLCLNHKNQVILLFSMVCSWVTLGLFYLMRTIRIRRLNYIPDIEQEGERLLKDEIKEFITNSSSEEFSEIKSVLFKKILSTSFEDDGTKINCKVLRNSSQNLTKNNKDFVFLRSFYRPLSSWEKTIIKLGAMCRFAFMIDVVPSITAEKQSSDKTSIGTKTRKKPPRNIFSEENLGIDSLASSLLGEEFGVNRIAEIVTKVRNIRKLEKIRMDFRTNAGEQSESGTITNTALLFEILATAFGLGKFVVVSHSTSMSEVFGLLTDTFLTKSCVGAVFIAPCVQPPKFFKSLYNCRFEEEIVKNLMKAEFKEVFPHVSSFKRKLKFDTTPKAFDEFYNTLIFEIIGSDGKDIFAEIREKTYLLKNKKYQIIRGENDYVSEENTFRNLSKFLKSLNSEGSSHASIRTIKNCGFYPQEEREDILAEAIAAFTLKI